MDERKNENEDEEFEEEPSLEKDPSVSEVSNVPEKVEMNIVKIPQ